MKRMFPIGIAVVVGIVMLASSAGVVRGGRLKTWNHSASADFEKAKLAGVVVSNTGALRLSRQLRPLSGVEAAHVWALAEDAAGNLYAGTGDEGKVFKIAPNGTTTVAYTSDQSQVLALVPDAKGEAIYAGTGPEATIVRLNAFGEKVLCKLPESYVWAMARAPKGDAFYAATGPHGRIYRVTPEGKFSVFYETRQDHVLCLAVGPDGMVYAGTDKTGRVYRIDPRGKGFVLHQTDQAEVRTLHLTEQALYIGTAGTKKRASATVASTAAKDSAKADRKEKDGEAVRVVASEKPAKLSTSKTVQRGKTPTKGSAAPAPKAPAADENGIYRIALDGAVREVYRGKLLVLSLMQAGNRLLAGTGMDGRLVEVDEAEREHTEIARLDHGQILCQLQRKDGSIVLGVGDPGKLFVLEDRYVAKGTVISEVLDAKMVSRWGALRWRSQASGKTDVSVAVRSGNVAEPDETWSDWSAEETKGPEANIKAPAARYLQYRVTLTSTDLTQTPLFRGLALRYATANQAPEVTKLRVPDLMTEKLDAPGKMKFTWSATDANEDEVRYRLLVRKDGWEEWVEIEEDLEKSELEWDSSAVPSGLYRLKVVASDHADNPEGQALTGSRQSERFVVCHEAPKVALKVAGVEGGRMVIEATAASNWVRLTQATFAVNGKRWLSAFPEDGLFDEKRETFRFKTEELRPGKYVVVLKVQDAAGNTGSGDVVFSIPQTQPRSK